LISIIGSGDSEQHSRRVFAPDEEIPESGIYQVMHESGEKDTSVFLRGSLFPACPDCGLGVRYSIVRAAPYIFDDKDFK
jgi:hypothetical protein